MEGYQLDGHEGAIFWVHRQDQLAAEVWGFQAAGVAHVDPRAARVTVDRLQSHFEVVAGIDAVVVPQGMDDETRVASPEMVSDIGELLTREVRVRMPDLEIERPQRDDALLTEVAEKTNGIYFVGMDDAMNRTGSGVSLASVIEPQDQTTYLPGTPNQNFATKLMGWLLALICGVLCLEWIIRRLSKLA